MITDRRVFDEDFVPRQLQHRGDEMSVLAWAFHPAARRDPARNVLVHGPSGVGKTVLVRHALERLREGADVPTAFVECMGRSTAAILREILDDLGVDVAANTPTADLEVQLRERVDRPTIVVLDEADGLPELDVLRYLVEADDVAIVPICHDAPDWLARTDDVVRQEFSGPSSRELPLSRYSVNELANILEARAENGLRHDAVDREQLETIADRVAGVARFGIQSLRAAAEIAAEREHTAIRSPDVRDSFERARRRIRAANLDSLPFHHHVLYEIIRRGEVMTSPEIHERYEAIADDVYRGRDQTPIGERSRRNKLQKLRDYDLIDWDGENKYREFWVRDETLQSPIEVNAPVDEM